MGVELQERNSNGFTMDQTRWNPENGVPPKDFDEDGRERRTGTLMSATAHVITAVIGSGVLSLAWAVAQLGWIGGPAILLAFSFITWFTSTLLADCYRSPDPITGNRNYTYMDVVRANLGGTKNKLCGLAQYGNIVGSTIGYTITASISMVAFVRANCFHKNGHNAKCHTSNYTSMMIFGAVEVILSQIQNFHKLAWLSVVAAVMSFTYASIGLGLSIAKLAENGHSVRTSLTGTTIGVDVTGAEKVWNTFQAIGNIAFAYAFSTVLVEIQDTLKYSPPENKVMKKASLIACAVTTFFYALCGLIGYAAFGNEAPGNFLTGFGFYEPYWLIDFGNACVVLHLVGAYQVFCQPLFAFVERWSSSCWPENRFITTEHELQIPFYGVYYLNMFHLLWRTIFVIFTIVVSMILPFFNDFVGLLGAITFYPLTVYFPVEMYISQAKIRKYSTTWIWLKILCWTCMIVSLLAAAGSIQGLIKSLKIYKPFQV